MPSHYLTPLLAPRSVALVGASERDGSLGRIVWKNLAGGGLRGELVPVNPKHGSVYGRRAYARLTELPAPVDLAVIATPARTVPRIVEDAGRAGIRAAVVLTSGFGETGEAGRALEKMLLDAARAGGVRLLGPNCLGLIRTDCGLNATFARGGALPGTLALVSQSGAICTAVLDWAQGTGIGFSSVVSLGGAADVDFGEVLDFLVADAATRAILLYVEGVRDARRYVSALRTAARVKPVIALKVGRFASGSQAASSHTGAMMGSDAVFDAALRRAGTVRVKTYTQLFAAARALSTERLPQGERLAILTNGGGPGVVAADCATENGVPLARLSPQTIAVLDDKLPAQWSHGNPIDIIGDAPAQRFADAAAAALADSGVDALLAMYSPVAVTEPEDAARAVAQAAAASRKPVLAAWLGDINPSRSRKFLDDYGIANFYTPENAVEAFSFLCAHRRNQAQLMQAPPAASVHEPRTDLPAAIALFEHARAAGRRILDQHESRALLSAFGLPVIPSIVATTRDAAVAAAREVGFPAALKVHSPDITHKSDFGGVRLGLQDEASVAAAFDGMLAQVRRLRPQASIKGAVVQPMIRYAHAREVLAGVAADEVFGPVLVFGSGGIAVEAVRDTAVALPPLNAMLARELMERTRVFRLLQAYRDVPAADLDSLAGVLLGLSRIACTLPWVREIDLNPVLAHPDGAVIVDARVAIDPQRPVRADRRYRHMAIHPYPAELEEEIVLREGSRVRLRPMRPEDAVLERRFFDNLSERSRYQRFMQYLRELSPPMLARFTQLDYDRELALIAQPAGGDEIVAVGRYAPNADGRSAEFALVTADAWQGRGLGRALLERLVNAAREAGYEALYGHILGANREMLDLAARLGFIEQDREGETVSVVRALK